MLKTETRRKKATVMIALAGVLVTLLVGYWNNSKPDPQSMLTGRITNTGTDNPIERAVVTLESQGITVNHTESDSNGSYYLGLPPNLGTGEFFLLKVKASGFREHRQIVSPAHNSYVNVHLFPFDQPAPSPSSAPTRDRSGVESVTRRILTERINRCEALLNALKYQDAIKECDAAIKVDPSNRRARELRREIEDAMEIFQK